MTPPKRGSVCQVAVLEGGAQLVDTVADSPADVSDAEQEALALSIVQMHQERAPCVVHARVDAAAHIVVRLLPPRHRVFVAGHIQQEETRDSKRCDEGQPRLHEYLRGAIRRASRREDSLVAPAGPLHVGHEALGAPCAQPPQPAVRGGFSGQADIVHGVPPRGWKGVCRTRRNGPTPMRTFVADLVVRSDEPRVPEYMQALIKYYDGRAAEEGIRGHGSSSGDDFPKERAAAVALVQCFHSQGGDVSTPRAQTRGCRNKRRVEGSKRFNLSGRAQCKWSADVSKLNTDTRGCSHEDDWGDSSDE
eukprot:scaffold17319_cov99-Phaeocystis_antarctica.AAC.4